MNRKISFLSLTLIIVSSLGVFISSCKKDDPEPIPVVTSIELLSGDDQTATVESTLSEQIEVIVKDQNGAFFAGTTVHFGVTEGSVSPTTVSTDADGKATVSWTLGATFGEQTLTASVGDKSITISANGEAVPLIASSIELVSGGDQTGIIETTLANPVVVLVKDQNGNAFESASVTFSTIEGSISMETATTNAEGHAETTWTLGASLGEQTLNAALGEELITITAIGEPVPLVATSIELVSGGDQAATIETELVLPIVVIVKDQNGDAFEGTSISFTTTAGSVSSTIARSDINGNATTTWTLGGIVGTQTLTVTGFTEDGTTALVGSPLSVSATGEALEIGDFHQGGVIFYLNGNGGGLVCAISDQDQGLRAEWGCHGTDLTGASGTAIGTGAQNTLDIEAGCSTSGTAADLCAILDLNGFNDWFLPSKNELTEMYTHRAAINTTAVNHGGNEFTFYYWSSSENNNNYTWRRNFDNGTQNGCAKHLPNRVRAVRAF